MQIFLIIFPVTNEKTKKFSSKISKKLYDVYYKTRIFFLLQMNNTKKSKLKKPRSSILKNEVVQCILKTQFFLVTK